MDRFEIDADFEQKEDLVTYKEYPPRHNYSEYFKQYPYRQVFFFHSLLFVDFRIFTLTKKFLAVGLFMMASFANTLMYSTCAPFAKALTEIYNIEPITVNAHSLIFQGLHPIASFPANFVLDKYGLKLGIIIGVVLSAIGSVIKMMINRGFYFVLLGQVLGAIGNPFITNGPTKLAATWFFPENRPIITTILTLTISLSGIVSYALPTFLINIDPKYVEDSKDHMFYLMFIEAVIVVALSLPCIFLMKEKPETPPSISAATKKEDFRPAMRTLVRNRDYIFLAVTGSLYFGTINAITIVLGMLIHPFNHSSDDSAYIIFSVAAGGVFGIIAGNYWMKKTNAYKTILIVSAVCIVIGLLLFGCVLFTEDLLLACLGAFFFGVFLTPFFPFCLEFACELVFPIGEASASGFILAGVHVIGLVQGTSISFIVDGKSKSSSVSGLFFFLGGFLIGLFFLIFVKEDLKRSKFEKTNSSLLGLDQKQNHSSSPQQKPNPEQAEEK